MYKSPVDIIYGQMQTQMEGDILRAVQSYGINVDKEELIRALQYDRDQYNRGYEDGRSDAVARGRWVRRIIDVSVPYYWKDECSICGFAGDTYFKYCPICGANMRSDNDKV